jgi:hypothetical protein
MNAVNWTVATKPSVICSWTVLAAALSAAPLDRLRSAPPEEIRIGSLGRRGVVFTEERPGTFDEAISAAGDVNGDGNADFLLLHYDISLDYEPTVFLVYGRPDLPESIKASELKGFATVFRRSTPRLFPPDLIQGMAPAGDEDGDGFDDFFIFRPAGAPEDWPLIEIGALPGLVYLVHGAASLPPEVGLDAPPAGVEVHPLHLDEGHGNRPLPIGERRGT